MVFLNRHDKILYKPAHVEHMVTMHTRSGKHIKQEQMSKSQQSTSHVADPIFLTINRRKADRELLLAEMRSNRELMSKQMEVEMEVSNTHHNELMNQLLRLSLPKLRPHKLIIDILKDGNLFKCII